MPLTEVLRAYLVAHGVARADADGALVFGRSATVPFSPSAIYDRSARLWKAAGLIGIRLHEARHTAASHMIAAGVNAKAISTFMGHANISTTYDLYGHLMPGSEAEAATLLNSYLAQALATT